MGVAVAYYSVIYLDQPERGRIFYEGSFDAGDDAGAVKMANAGFARYPEARYCLLRDQHDGIVQWLQAKAG